MSKYESELARKIAKMIPSLKTAKDCNTLAQALKEKRNQIIQKLQQEKIDEAWAKLKQMPEGTLLMRAPNISAWDLAIKAGEACALYKVYEGRKHKGFWVVPESRKERTINKEKYVWIDKFRAPSLVPYEPPADPKSLEIERRGEAMFHGLLGTLNERMGDYLGKGSTVPSGGEGNAGQGDKDRGLSQEGVQTPPPSGVDEANGRAPV
jgi:hypothetical protein